MFCCESRNDFDWEMPRNSYCLCYKWLKSRFQQRNSSSLLSHNVAIILLYTSLARAAYLKFNQSSVSMYVSKMSVKKCVNVLTSVSIKFLQYCTSDVCNFNFLKNWNSKIVSFLFANFPKRSYNISGFSWFILVSLLSFSIRGIPIGWQRHVMCILWCTSWFLNCSTSSYILR